MKNTKENVLPTKINLGCGDQELSGYIGLDFNQCAGAHVICNFNQSIPLVTQSVDHIYAKSLLEHIQKLVVLLTEAQRVLKPGGTFYIYVPHWSNPLYYSDYTHRRFFGLATFDYFTNTDEQIYRQVPIYTQLQFKVARIRLIFYSPFRLLRWLMKGFQWLVNCGVGPQLLYEYHFAHLIPCYAIEFLLRRTLGQADA